MARPTLREVTGMGAVPAPLSQSTLVMIDCQNTYRSGVMQLEGVEEALEEAQALLRRFREAGRPIIHIVHDAGPGTPYDISAEIGQIAAPVAPVAGEPVISKNYPSSFEKTSLDEVLKSQGAENLVLAGFMTHMCVNSTARAAFNHGYKPVVVAAATATRTLPLPTGGSLSARDVHNGALAGLADLFAVVVARGSDIPA